MKGSGSKQMDKLRWVLERHEQDVVQLSEYLAGSAEAEVSVKKLVEQFGWSRYRVVTTTHTLIDELALLPSQAQRPAKYTVDSKMIYIDHNVQIDHLELEHHFRQNSLVWAFLLETLSEDFTSYEKFADQHHTSVSILRSIKERIRHNLAEVNIELTKTNHVVGNEVDVRVCFLRMMRHYHHYDELPAVQNQQATIQQVIDQLIQIYALPDQKIVRHALRLQVIIWMMRMREGHYLHAQPLPKVLKPISEWASRDREQGEAVMTLINQFCQLPHTILRGEVEFAVLCLYSSGVAKTDPTGILTDDVLARFAQAETIILATFKNWFGQALPATALPAIRQQLVAPNLRVMYRVADQVKEQPDIARLARAYPIQVRFVQQILHEIAVAWGFDPSTEAEFVPQVFDEYFNAVIAVMPKKLMLPPIKITLDFLYLPTLGQLLAENLQLCQSVNFDIQADLATADYYISDTEISDYDQLPGYIWTTYPDEKQLEQFIEQARLLSVARFETQVESVSH